MLRGDQRPLLRPWMKILKTNDFFCQKTIIIHQGLKDLVITALAASGQPLFIVPEHTPNPVEQYVKYLIGSFESFLTRFYMFCYICRFKICLVVSYSVLPQHFVLVNQPMFTSLMNPRLIWIQNNVYTQPKLSNVSFFMPKKQDSLLIQFPLILMSAMSSF